MSTYSIDQFSKITGLNKILLRTWENRYGFIVPSRTDTNLRLYDDNMIVKALNTKILIDNNFKISHIAKMTINQIMSMVNALKNENVVNQHDLLITKTIESGLNFDKKLFEKTYENGIDKFGIVEFYEKVLIQALNKIGILWLTNYIAPSQEHFLVELIKTKIAKQIEEQKSVTKSDTWVLFLPENEFHEIGLLVSHLILKLNGYNVIYLGANLPFSSLKHVVEKVDVDKLLFFAVSNPIISNIDYTIEYLKNLKPEAQRFLITSKDRAKGKELNKNANVIYDIQEFIKLIA